MSHQKKKQTTKITKNKKEQSSKKSSAAKKPAKIVKKPKAISPSPKTLKVAKKVPVATPKKKAPAQIKTPLIPLPAIVPAKRGRKKKATIVALAPSPVVPKITVLPPGPPPSTENSPADASKIDSGASSSEKPKPTGKPKIKRKIKRGKGGPGNYYFTKDTQAAIVEFNTCQDAKLKNQIYRDKIAGALNKLVENLINIHKFSSMHDSYDDLKNDCINFLFETLSKFNPAYGSNAFSYFNVVAKNWLIIKTKQKGIKTKTMLSLDDPDALTRADMATVEEQAILPAQDDVVDNKATINGIISMLYEIKLEAKTENEVITIDSIIAIFEKIEDIDLLNKNAVMLYMRELTRLSPKQLTGALQNLKKVYRKVKEEHIEEEELEFMD